MAVSKETALPLGRLLAIPASVRRNARWSVRRVVAASVLCGGLLLSYLAIMIALGYCLQMAMLGLKADNPSALLVERVNNRNFTSYFSYALAHPDLKDYFSGYPATLYKNPYPHTQAHPPGPDLFYRL